jgi:hypothetical protein
MLHNLKVISHVYFIFYYVEHEKSFKISCKDDTFGAIRHLEVVVTKQQKKACSSSLNENNESDL